MQVQILKAIHNKDYSVVKTFKAAFTGRFLSFTIAQRGGSVPPDYLPLKIKIRTHRRGYDKTIYLCGLLFNRMPRYETFMETLYASIEARVCYR